MKRIELTHVFEVDDLCDDDVYDWLERELIEREKMVGEGLEDCFFDEIIKKGNGRLVDWKIKERNEWFWDYMRKRRECVGCFEEEESEN